METKGPAPDSQALEATNESMHTPLDVLTIDMAAMQPGDAIIALRDDGLRGSGIPEAELALSKGLGDHWQDVKVLIRDDSDDQQELGKFIYQPPAFEASATGDLLEDLLASQIAVHGLGNLRGGGLAYELRGILCSSGLGANITDPYEPSRVMRLIQTFHRELVGEAENTDTQSGEDTPTERPATDWDMYFRYPMGQGPLIISPQPKEVISAVEKFGQQAKSIGHVTVEPTIHIRSRGMNQPDVILEYEV